MLAWISSMLDIVIAISIFMVGFFYIANIASTLGKLVRNSTYLAFACLFLEQLIP